MTNKNQKKEYDVSDEVWEWYKIIYSGEQGLSYYFDLENPLNKNKRAYAVTRAKNFFDDAAKLMEISGDIIFNFSSKGPSGQSRYDLLKKYIQEIEDEDLRNLYFQRLDYCCDHNYSKENCALMPKQGKLQISKQGIGNDRGDTFIWALDAYYEYGIEILLNHSSKENKKIIISYLETLRKPGKHMSIYNYCKLFFNITSTEFIDELIEQGSKTIDSEFKARIYIDSALKFWKKRIEHYDSCV